MTRLTDEQLEEIERRYAPAESQKCRVCGAPLTFASSAMRGSIYACSSDEANVLKAKFPGLDAAEHARKSEWQDHSQSDRNVIALVRELREARLPVQEQLDLREVEASQAVLKSVLGKVRSIPLTPKTYGSSLLYFKSVAEVIEEHLRQWGVTEEEILND